MVSALLKRIVAGCLAAACACAAWPQDYPTRPLRLVVPFPPGASNDVIARAYARKLAEALSQQVVIDNRAGAGGSIGVGIVAAAPGDGHTLMVTSTSFATNAATQAGVPYDPVK